MVAAGYYEQSIEVRSEYAEVNIHSCFLSWKAFKQGYLRPIRLTGVYILALQKGFTNPKTGQSLQMDGIFARKQI